MPDFLELALSGIPDMKPAPADQECEVSIISAQLRKKEETGTQWLNLCLEVPGDSTVPNFYHMLFLPNSTRTEKENMVTNNRLKTFFKAFSLPLDQQILPEEDGSIREWTGNTGWVILGVDPAGERNTIKRIEVRS